MSGNSNTRNLRPRKLVNYLDVVRNESFAENDVKIPSPFKNDVRVIVKRLVSDDSDDNYELSSDSESDLFFKPKKLKKSQEKSLLAMLAKSDEIDDEENEYRLQRQKNMADRLTVLKTMDFVEDVKKVTSVLNISNTIQKINNTPKSKPKFKALPPLFPQRQQPPRRSKNSLTEYLKYDVEENRSRTGTTEEDELQSSRVLEDNLSLIDEEKDSDILERIKQEIDIPYDSVCDFTTCDLQKFYDTVKSCHMFEEPIKIIKSRITCLGFHPNDKKLLIVAGDKLGNLSLWDIAAKEGIVLQAHDFNVNCASFSNKDNAKFYSTSLDGTTRKGDIINNSLDLLYSSAKESSGRECHTTWHHEMGDVLMIAKGDGVVKFLDTRQQCTKVPTYKCHPRSVRTVETNPCNENYFLTSSGTGTFAIWDIRNMKSKDPKAVLIEDLYKALTSAFYSCSGSYVLTTSNDDTIRIYDCREDKAKSHVQIPHNNHGGRWLSQIKARWQPQREDCFYVGSMLSNPKRIQAYNFNGRVFYELKSPMMKTYSPVVTIHPSKPIVVGGNGSGKIHVFSPFKDLTLS